MPVHSLLIVGCGSLGERHLRAFQRCGRVERLAVCDSQPGAAAQLSAQHEVPGFANMFEALQTQAFTGLVIATPAHTHLAIAREGARHGLALLIEKPLAVGLDGLEQTRTTILQAERFAGVAYLHRCMPWIASARAFLRGGELGRPLHATVCAGQHLPAVRPRYAESSYARAEEGGGAIQDALTQLAQVMEWCLGPVTALFADAARQSLKGVTVEDTVNVSARHGSVLVSYALNQFQAANEMRFQIHGERGSLCIESHRQRWGCLLQGEREWLWHEAALLQRDDIFLAQAHAFLDACEGRPNSLCTFDEAAQTLRFNLATLESARAGLPVTL